MADIIPVEPSQYRINKLTGDITPQFKDKYFTLLVILAVLSLLVAIATGIYTRFFYDGSNSPFELQTLVILQAVFGLLAIGFYIAALWRILTNVSLQAIAGCPSCQHHELMRIRRTSRDRLITLSGIRVARFQCRNCRWNGRRVFRANYHPLMMELRNDLDAAYVQPDVIPVAKKKSKPAQPESLSLEDDSAVKIVKPAVAVDELAVEAGDFDLEISGSDTTIVESEPAQTTEASDYSASAASLIDASIIDAVALDTAPENVISAGPITGDTNLETGNLEQETSLILGKRAKINTTFGINLREQPGPDSKWVGLLGPETIVTLNKSKKLADGTVWYYVISGDQIGWVENSCLEPAK